MNRERHGVFVLVCIALMASAFDPRGPRRVGCSVLNKSRTSVIKRAPRCAVVGSFSTRTKHKGRQWARDSCGGGYSKSHCSRTPVNRPRAALHWAGASQFNVIFHYNGQWRQKTATPTGDLKFKLPDPGMFDSSEPLLARSI